jgi:hypothetical protein
MPAPVLLFPKTIYYRIQILTGNFKIIGPYSASDQITARIATIIAAFTMSSFAGQIKVAGRLVLDQAPPHSVTIFKHREFEYQDCVMMAGGLIDVKPEAAMLEALLRKLAGFDTRTESGPPISDVVR